MVNYDDVNADGFTDLVIHVITQELNLTPNDTLKHPQFGPEIKKFLKELKNL